MLRHVVMMKFTDRTNWESIAQEVARMLNQLTETIPELQCMEVGINMSSRPTAYDLVLTADFRDESGLEAYRVHPTHQAVLDILKMHVQETTVVDYLINK